MEIRTFGRGERLEACARELALAMGGGECETSRLFVLPIPSTVDGKIITGTENRFSEALGEVGTGDAVAGYSIPENIKSELCERGARVYDASLDEKFLLRNAEVTARGALGYILTEFKKDIADLSIGIIGYGRIGACLLRYLLSLGASVTLYTTRESVAMELCSLGVRASVAFEGLSELDLVVNTAPARLLKDAEVREALSHGRIFDLASGKVFEETEGVTKLSSIPGKFYPLSAGKIYAEHIIGFLGKECAV